MTDYRNNFDQEDRFNELIGVVECVQELLAYQEPGSRVRAEPLAYYMQMVVRLTREAVPNGQPRHRAPVND